MESSPTKRGILKRWLRFPIQSKRNAQNAPRSNPMTPDGGSPPHSPPHTPAEDVTANPSGAVGSSVGPTSLQRNEQGEPSPTIVSHTALQADQGVSGGFKNVPCLEKAIQAFKVEHEDWYQALFENENLILNMATADTLSHMAVPEGLQETMGRIQTFIRKSQTYLPSLGNVQALAMGLSRLDPHGIAPLVLTGVLFVIQLTLNTVKPEVKEKLLTLLSKSTSIMNKWILFETGHARSTPAFLSNYFEEVEKLLPLLYKGAFETISRIHQVCKSKASVLVLEDRLPELQLRLSNLENKDRTCTTNREKVDMDLRSKVDKQNLLKWLKGANDPEPSHTNVMCQTGLDDPNTKAAAWFLETSEFKSWVAKLIQDNAERVFWLNGIMGTGKTTLVCRVISYFKQYPLDKTRTVFYYCNASATENQGRGPSYEEIIRGLCSKLAWNEAGELASSAKEFYQRCNSENEKAPHTNRWEQLLRDIINQIDDRILIIIDALDERSSREDERKFLDFVRSMQHKLYMLLSSRPQVEVAKYMGPPIIKCSVVADGAEEDMNQFIKKQIDEKKVDQTHSQSIILKGEYLNRLVMALTSQANGMFRWVEVWLGVFFNPNEDAISIKKDAELKLKALEDAKLPNDEDTMALAYKMLWDTNGGNSEERKRHQIRALRFVLSARRSLSAQELLQAIRFDPEAPREYADEIEMNYLEGLFHNFMEIRSRQFVFEHVSAKAFILGMKDPASQQRLFADESWNHRTIAETSLLLLRNPDHRLWKDCPDDWDELKSIIELEMYSSRQLPYDSVQRITASESFHSYERYCRTRDGIEITDNYTALVYYIMFNWWWHCGMIQNDAGYAELRETTLETLRDMPIALQCDALIQESMRVSCVIENSDGKRVIDPLFFALARGLYPFQSTDDGIELCSNFGDILTRSVDQHTTLGAALLGRNHRSVQALLDIHSRADGNMPLMYDLNTWRNSLFWLGKDDKIVQTLLEFEAKPLDLSIIPSDKRLQSRLLQTTVDSGETLLYHFFGCCSGDLIIWILERFEVHFHEDTRAIRRPILPPAARCRSKRVIRLLLDQGALIDDVEDTYGTALGVAAEEDNEDMVKFLLEQGADVNCLGGDDGTPLGAAVAWGTRANVDVIGFFLRQKDIDVDLAIRLSRDFTIPQWEDVADMYPEVASALQRSGRRQVGENTVV